MLIREEAEHRRQLNALEALLRRLLREVDADGGRFVLDLARRVEVRGRIRSAPFGDEEREVFGSGIACEPGPAADPAG